MASSMASYGQFYGLLWLALWLPVASAMVSYGNFHGFPWLLIWLPLVSSMASYGKFYGFQWLVLRPRIEVLRLPMVSSMVLCG